MRPREGHCERELLYKTIRGIVALKLKLSTRLCH